jgi:PadR family transcriptional regulator PadR
MGERNPSFLTDVPERLVLRILREHEMCGYELVQTIRDRTDAGIALGEGAVYPVLHALERQGALTSRRLNIGGRSRVCYAITASGTRRLADRTGTWSRLTSAILDFVAGGTNVGAA